MRLSILLVAAVVVVSLASDAGSQGVVGYDPEIGTVMGGVVHDVRPVISADRRYVQIDVRSGVAVIEDIYEFETIVGGIF